MLMFRRKRRELIVIGDALTIWPTDMGCGWVRVEIDGAWPQWRVGKVRLPMCPGEMPLFDPAYACPVGVMHSVSDRPGFDLEEGDTLHFSCDAFVHVVEVRRSSVSLGIHAPPEIPLHRWETFLSIVNEGRPPPALS